MSECGKINNSGNRSCKLNSLHKCEHQFTTLYCDECKEEIASNSYCSCVGLSQEKLTQANIKEIQALKEQLEKSRSTQEMLRFGRGLFMKKVGELKEQLARMGELGWPVLKLLGEAGGRQLEISRKFNDALSSYDPKWIEGVRADVWEKAAKIARHYSEGINPHLSDTAEANYYRSIEIADRLKLEAGKSRQSNQSKGEKGKPHE